MPALDTHCLAGNPYQEMSAHLFERLLYACKQYTMHRVWPHTVADSDS